MRTGALRLRHIREAADVGEWPRGASLPKMPRGGEDTHHMPLKNGKQVCVNHPEQEMMTHAGFNTLVKVSKEGSELKLDTKSGILCAVLMCPSCGYIELYNAKQHEFWENPPDDCE